ncbi:unnamed protein product, partial [Rotaria sp. Silwood2]
VSVNLFVIDVARFNKLFLISCLFVCSNSFDILDDLSSSSPSTIFNGFNLILSKSICLSSLITINNNEHFNSLNQYQFSYDLFNKNNLLHPYISIHSLDIINNSNINSYLIGASNRLYRQQNNIDFILTDYDDDFIIQSSILKQQLQLTTADLRFTQLFEDSQS